MQENFAETARAAKTTHRRDGLQEVLAKRGARETLRSLRARSLDTRGNPLHLVFAV